jgi:hypothetical protein
MHININVRPASSKKPPKTNSKHNNHNRQPKDEINKIPPRNRNKSAECIKKRYLSPSKKKTINSKAEKEEFNLSQAMRLSR